MNLYEYQVLSIDYVVDGDTADLMIDLGFTTTRTERVRLYGIDTPERGDEGYAAAKDYVTALQYRLYVKESTVFIRSYRDKHDSFGRYLATLYEVQGSAAILDVCQDMINRGLAQAYVAR